mgnify:CR=1 FL=1
MTRPATDPELAILIGLPGAGKSTFFATRLAPTHVHVSLDALGRGRDARARQRRSIATALAAGRSVAVDNVNPTRAERAEIFALPAAADARVVGYWLDAPPRVRLARNAGRTGRARLPPVAIFAFAKRFEPPGTVGRIRRALARRSERGRPRCRLRAHRGDERRSRAAAGETVTLTFAAPVAACA